MVVGAVKQVEHTVFFRSDAEKAAQSGCLRSLACDSPPQAVPKAPYVRANTTIIPQTRRKVSRFQPAYAVCFPVFLCLEGNIAPPLAFSLALCHPAVARYCRAYRRGFRFLSSRVSEASRRISENLTCPCHFDREGRQPAEWRNLVQNSYPFRTRFSTWLPPEGEAGAERLMRGIPSL